MLLIRISDQWPATNLSYETYMPFFMRVKQLDLVSGQLRRDHCCQAAEVSLRSIKEVSGQLRRDHFCQAAGFSLRSIKEGTIFVLTWN